MMTLDLTDDADNKWSLVMIRGGFFLVSFSVLIPQEQLVARKFYFKAFLTT